MAKKHYATRDRQEETPETSRERMPSVRKNKSEEKNPVVLIACSDLHLSHRPPIARAKEENWYAAMGRSLHQLEEIRKTYRCPVVLAGDVFDDGWRPHKCPPELINFAVDLVGRNGESWYGIPGQHDLPHHNYEDIIKSAFWTLVAARRIVSISSEISVELGTDGLSPPIRLHAFPWGFPVVPLKDRSDLVLEVAVCHQYVWTKDTGYPNAPKNARLKNLFQNLKGYDLAIFGDNHKGFYHESKKGGCHVLNCGAFMRRNSDQKDYKPHVGLVHADGTVALHYLDISQDVFDDTVKDDYQLSKDIPLSHEFISSLRDLGDSVVNFSEAMTRYRQTHGVPDRVWDVIVKALEKS